MTEVELRKYYEVITDCWKLFKDFSTPTGSEDFWQGLIRKCNELHDKHRRSVYSEAMINATINEIDRIYKTSIKGIQAVYPVNEIQTSIFQMDQGGIT